MRCAFQQIDFSFYAILQDGPWLDDRSNARDNKKLKTLANGLFPVGPVSDCDQRDFPITWFAKSVQRGKRACYHAHTQS